MVDKTERFNHLEAAHDVFKGAQWSDQFHCYIARTMPTFDQDITPDHITDVAITYRGIELEAKKIGGGAINVPENIGELSISITFVETHNRTILDFLTMKNGAPILPTDGTFLLPDDWYYHIDIFQLDSQWQETKILSGDFLMDGGMEKTFTSDGGAIQKITAQFKPKFEGLVQYG